MLLTDVDNLISVSTHTHTLIHRSPEQLQDKQRTYLAERRRFIIDKYKAEGIELIVKDNIV